jgi:FdrA protein
VGLGFANVVQPGPVSLVAASGTGAQQLLCLLDAAGVGVRHCLGVGGRDLSTDVGGRSTLQALTMLDEDPGTELIVLVSKPPADEVAEMVTAAAGGLRTPVVLALLGQGSGDLTAAAATVCEALGQEFLLPEPLPVDGTGSPRGTALRGLFSGGTLCDEAMVIAAGELGPVRSNIPLRRDWALPENLRADGHVMIDFGDDRLTQGRPHPMIDLGLRVERLRDEGADASTGAVLLDVVLGHGAHADPAAELAPAISGARAAAAAGGRDLAVVVSLCGTEGDPQGLERQGVALAAAGATVHRSNAAAARAAVALVKGQR